MSSPTLTTIRTRQIRHWFNVSPPSCSPPVRCVISPPGIGQIYLITGPSGSGKSRLLNHLRRRWRKSFSILNLDKIVLPGRATIDCFEHLTLADALRLLSSVGLAETHIWLLPPRLLSKGQRWRLKLALALTYINSTTHPTLLLADEFASCLDPLTARIIAHTLRRQISKLGLRILIATSQPGLLEALCPDQVIHCDFGSIRIQSPPKASPCAQDPISPAGSSSNPARGRIISSSTASTIAPNHRPPSPSSGYCDILNPTRCREPSASPSSHGPLPATSADKHISTPATVRSAVGLAGSTSTCEPSAGSSSTPSSGASDWQANSCATPSTMRPRASPKPPPDLPPSIRSSTTRA